MPPPDTHSPIYILYMQSSLLASDPKALTFEDAERLNLKITPDIKFMLQVEYNLHSPKMAQAMLNLRLEPAHLDKKYLAAQLDPSTSFDSLTRTFRSLFSATTCISIKSSIARSY